MNAENANSKVLVLSANKQTSATIDSILKSFDYKDIEHQDNGIVGLKSLMEKRHNFVICDSNIRFINGWLFIKEIKTSDKIPNIPTILIGEADAPAKEEELKQYGILRYLKAPYSNSDLSFLINSTVQLFKTSGTIENKYSKAKEALITNQSQKAVELYSELRSLTENSTRSSLGLAEAYTQAKDTEKAEKIIVEMPESDDMAPASIMIKAKIYLQKKQTVEAKSTIDNLLTKIAPDTAFYYSKAVRLYLDFKQTDLAELVCNAAIRKQFKVPDFSLTIARCRIQTEKYDETLAIIKNVEAQFGPSLDALNLRAFCLKKIGRFLAAIETYEEALRFSPMDPKIYYSLAGCRIAMKDYNKAIDYLETCLRISPRYPKANDVLNELKKVVSGGVSSGKINYE